MINAFLLTSGWLFWLVIGFFILIEFATTEAESLAWSIVVFVAATLVVLLFSDADLVGLASRNPLLSVLMFPAYFIVGTMWSIWKWRGFVARRFVEFSGRKAELLKERERSSYPGTSFEEYARGRGFPPSASDSKERITTWIVAWPFSLLWSLLTYPRKLAAAIYTRLVTLFQRMSESTFDGQFRG